MTFFWNVILVEIKPAVLLTDHLQFDSRDVWKPRNREDEEYPPLYAYFRGS